MNLWDFGRDICVKFLNFPEKATDKINTTFQKLTTALAFKENPIYQVQTYEVKVFKTLLLLLLSFCLEMTSIPANSTTLLRKPEKKVKQKKIIEDYQR